MDFHHAATPASKENLPPQDRSEPLLAGKTPAPKTGDASPTKHPKARGPEVQQEMNLDQAWTRQDTGLDPGGIMRKRFSGCASGLEAEDTKHSNVPGQASSSAYLLRSFMVCNGVDLSEQHRHFEQMVRRRTAAYLAEVVPDCVDQSIHLATLLGRVVGSLMRKFGGSVEHQLEISISASPKPTTLDVALRDQDRMVPAWIQVSESNLGAKANQMWRQAVGVFQLHASRCEGDGWMRPLLAIEAAVTPAGKWRLRLWGYNIVDGSETAGSEVAKGQALQVASTVIMDCDGSDSVAVGRMLMVVVMHAVFFNEGRFNAVVNPDEVFACVEPYFYKIFDLRQEAKETTFLERPWHWQLAMMRNAELLVFKQDVVLIRQDYIAGDQIPKRVAEVIAVLQHLEEVHGRRTGTFGKAVGQIMAAGAQLVETEGGRVVLPPFMKTAVEDLQCTAGNERLDNMLKLCHGDVRGLNMVFCHSDPSQSRLVDFDLAGWQGRAAYCSNYNPRLPDGGRHPYARAGWAMEQQHDVWAFGQVMRVMANPNGLYGEMLVSPDVARHWEAAYEVLQGSMEPAPAISKALEELRQVEAEPIGWEPDDYDCDRS